MKILIATAYAIAAATIPAKAAATDPIIANVKQKCIAKWTRGEADDYSMIAYCIKTELEALAKINAISTPTTGQTYLDTATENPEDWTYSCQFKGQPKMTFTRPSAVIHMVEVAGIDGLWRLNVGSQFAIAEIKGREHIFWTHGASVEIDGKLYKGTCTTPKVAQ
ncbi:hypothetical protein [Sinorhizobium chiapasense]|uniref:C-type lysozyme inhibitor domain-containing protein n=1 Tax=Sinorhizobium chiapasense TaxID=501572 RepID=A0ABZ2B9E1_9HYPH